LNLPRVSVIHLSIHNTTHADARVSRLMEQQLVGGCLEVELRNRWNFAVLDGMKRAKNDLVKIHVLLLELGGVSCPAGCGLRFGKRNSVARHAVGCKGLVISNDRYGTYVYPFCVVAGYNKLHIVRHVVSCNGNRAALLGSRSDSVLCPNYGVHLLSRALQYHICRLVGDPLWFGKESKPPDMIISYVRWCRYRGLILGETPGDMLAAISDYTIAEPALGGSGRYWRPFTTPMQRRTSSL
jgi:hypothetical protein